MMKTKLLGLFFLAITGTAHAAPRIEIGNPNNVEGAVSVPVVITADSQAPVAAVGMELEFDPILFEKPTVAPGPAAVEAGKTVSINTSDHTCVIAIIGLNNNVIHSGTTAVVTFRRKTGIGFEPSVITYLPSASTPSGDEIAVASRAGAIQIR